MESETDKLKARIAELGRLLEAIVNAKDIRRVEDIFVAVAQARYALTKGDHMDFEMFIMGNAYRKAQRAVKEALADADIVTKVAVESVLARLASECEGSVEPKPKG
jgi:hypothetical protein